MWGDGDKGSAQAREGEFSAEMPVVTRGGWEWEVEVNRWGYGVSERERATEGERSANRWGRGVSDSRAHVSGK